MSGVTSPKRPAEELSPEARSKRLALLFLGGGTALCLFLGLFVEGYLEADDVNHFLFSRYAFDHPWNFLDVWARPLITMFYALPAQLGPGVARLFTVPVVAATAWVVYLTAREDLGRGVSSERRGGSAEGEPEWAVLFLFAQPYVVYLSHGFLTEPLFALLLALAVLALRRGRLMRSAGWVALSPLCRPEGFFVGVLWGALLLFDRDLGPLRRRLMAFAVLPSGAIAWAATGALASGDLLWIVHAWPWSAESIYSSRGFFFFFGVLPLLVSPVVFPAFLAGFLTSWHRGVFVYPLAAIYLVVLHATLTAFGLFGSAGYPRYLVTAAPLFALLGARGVPVLRRIFARVGSLRRLARPRVLAAVLVLGTAVPLVSSLRFALPWKHHFDFQVMQALGEWFARWSSAQGDPNVATGHPAFFFMAGLDPWERQHPMYKVAEAPGEVPPGTVVLWDNKFGPEQFGIEEGDLLRHGYEEIPKEAVTDVVALEALRSSMHHMYRPSRDFDWRVYRKQ